LILKQVTEDVLLTTTKSWTAESMEDQIKMTSVLKLMLYAQANHISQTTSKLEMNSDLLVEVLLIEKPEMADGDH
jgi:hypothetical protein